MKSTFFDIVFECNGRGTCMGCNDDVCNKFEKCFDMLPCLLWARITSFENISEYVRRWRVYNEQTAE